MTKTQTTKTASNHANISTWIDSLTTKRETWENGTYKASNEELYVLLDECVDLFKEVRAHRSLVKKLNLILEERDIMMRSNTSLATKIVRLIFGDCGKRAYTYARVLMVEAEQKGELQSKKSGGEEARGMEENRKEKKRLGKKKINNRMNDKEESKNAGVSEKKNLENAVKAVHKELKLERK